MKLLSFLNPFHQKSETKKYHEISKLGGEYSPFYPSQSSALNLRESYTGWVYNAVSVIANGVAKLPIHLLNERDKQFTHDYLKLLSYDLFEGITSYLKLRGTCYIWKNTIGATVRSLHILSPDLITPKWNSNKSEVLSYEYMLNGKVVPFDKKEIIVIMNFNPLQSYPYITQGMSDLQASALSVDTERAQSIYNWKTFENGANPGGVISTDKDLAQDQVERMQTAWNNKFKGANNAHKLAVLTQGATFQSVSLTPQDMAYIEGKRLTRDEILAVFKVPKAILGIGEGSGGNMNIRNFQELFARNAVEPVAIKIADALNRQLFNGIGLFEFYNIIPQDENQVRADYQSGILTLNEARSFRGMAPVKDGDMFIYSDTSTTATPTTIVQDEEPTKNILNISLKSAIDGIAESLIPGSEKAMILKVKKRDKRLTKYEVKIAGAVKSIAEQQEQEILSQIKDEKGIKPIKIDFNKYRAVWMLKLNPIYKMLFQEEGNSALGEVGVSTGFQIGAPEVAKRIKNNIYLLQKSVDYTTKDKLEKVFEKATSEGLGALATKDLIKDQFTMMKGSRAESIARTETIRMSNEASVTAWKDSGVVEKQEWWTALDDRVSDICMSLHGKTIALGDNFFEKGDTTTIGSTSYSFDYTDVGGPPSHVNCRCTLKPIISK